MPVDTQRLRSEHAILKNLMSQTFDVAERENRDFTPSERQAFDDASRRCTILESNIAEFERFASLTLPPEPTPPARQAPPTTVVVQQQPVPSVLATRRAASDAFGSWVRTGRQPAGSESMFTVLGANSFVPPNLIEIAPVPWGVNVFRDALALAGMRPIETPRAEDLRLPIVQSLPGGRIAENTTRDVLAEVDFSGDEDVDLTPRLYASGLAILSNTKILATGFDIAAYITADLRYSLELAIERDVAETIAADADVTQGVTLASANAAGVTRAKLVALARSLPDLYDRMRVIVLSRQAFEAAEDLVDADGRPLLDRDAARPDMLRLDGVPVLKSTSFPALAASKTVGVCLSMLGCRLRDVVPARVTRYGDMPSAPDAIGIELFANARFGYAASAVAKLKTPA